MFGPAPAVAPLRSRALVRDELPHAREAPGRDLALRNRAYEVRARIGAAPALVEPVPAERVRPGRVGAGCERANAAAQQVEHGRFDFGGLPPGTYDLTVTNPDGGTVTSPQSMVNS